MGRQPLVRGISGLSIHGINLLVKDSDSNQATQFRMGEIIRLHDNSRWSTMIIRSWRMVKGVEESVRARDRSSGVMRFLRCTECAATQSAYVRSQVELS